MKQKTIALGEKEQTAFQSLNLSIPIHKFVKGAFWEKIDKIRLEQGKLDDVFQIADKH